MTSMSQLYNPDHYYTYSQNTTENQKFTCETMLGYSKLYVETHMIA